MSRTQQIHEQLAERKEVLTLAKGKLSHAIQALARDPNDKLQMAESIKAKETINSLTPEIDSLTSALDAARAYDNSDDAKVKRAQRTETLASLKRESAKLGGAGRAVDLALSELLKTVIAHRELRHSVDGIYTEHLLLLPITQERRMNICASAAQELSDESAGFGQALGSAMLSLAIAAAQSCRHVVQFNIANYPRGGHEDSMEHAGKAIADMVMQRANDNAAMHADELEKP